MMSDSTTYRWPLFALLFLCFAAAILGDSTAEALLLSHFDASIVPRMFLVNALFLSIFSMFVISAVDRVDRGLFFAGMCGVHGGVLVLIRLSVMLNAQWLFLPLFSYAYITKILIFSLFWTLVNDLVDSRRAGTVFPFIAAGGTLGAISVSFSIPLILKLVDAKNLLVVWAVLAFVALGIFLIVRKQFGRAFQPSRDGVRKRSNPLLSIGSDLKIVRSEPLLFNMSIFYLILFILLLNQHFVFYQHIKAHFKHANELAGFLGLFNGISMGSTFLLQLTCSGYIIKKIGATRAMFLMPAVLTIVFAVLAVTSLTRNPGAVVAVVAGTGALFWPVVIGMGSRIAFFDSFFSPNFQLFFSSLPASLRGRGKFFMEGVVKPLAMVTASLWLMIASKWVPFSVWAAVLFVLASLLVVQTFRIRKRYTDSLVNFLTGGRINREKMLADAAAAAKDPAFLSMLAQALRDEEPGIRSYIAELLAEIRTDESIGILLSEIEVTDQVTRATIVSSLKGLDRPDVKKVLVDRLADADLRVAANAVDALAPFVADPAVAQALEPCLHSENRRIRGNAVVALWSVSDASERERMREVLRQMLFMGDDEDCAAALHSMSRIADAEALQSLDDFSCTHTARIVGSHSLLRQFTNACADSPEPRALQILLRLCRMVNRKQRHDIATAVSSQLNRGLPAQSALDMACSADTIGRSVVLNGLTASGWHPEQGSAQENQLLGLGLEEIRAAYGDWLNLAAIDRHPASEPSSFLRTVLVEGSLQFHVDNAASVASLLDKSDQIRRILPRLRHDDRHVRARAFEVLDNAGASKVNRPLVELLDSTDSAVHARRAAALLGAQPPSYEAAVQQYRNHPSPWVQECVAYALEGGG